MYWIRLIHEVHTYLGGAAEAYIALFLAAIAFAVGGSAYAKYCERYRKEH